MILTMDDLRLLADQPAARSGRLHGADLIAECRRGSRVQVLAVTGGIIVEVHDLDFVAQHAGHLLELLTTSEHGG